MNSGEKALAEMRDDEAKQWQTPAERVRALGTHGARLPTGFPTLDRITRGGFMAGERIIVGGAPGAGKTSLIVQIARDYARKGHPVAILAADENAEGLLIRWGQQDGFSREALEAGNETVKESFASILESIPVDLVDADEVGAAVEDVAEKLARRSSEKTGVLFVDSLQTVRARDTGLDANPREQINSVMRALKRAARKHGLLVIATSELSRGAYSGHPKPVDPLAAFKESGGIEYGAAVALIIRCSPYAENIFEVYVPKNRPGGIKTWFWLEFDPERATFREVDAPAHIPRSATSKRSPSLRERVLSVLKTGVVFQSRSALWQEVGGNKQRTLEAIGALLQAGIIDETSKGICLARQGSESVPVPGSPYRGENREPNEPTAAVPVLGTGSGTGNRRAQGR